MSNFDLKKFLVENKLTANSKTLTEAAKKPTIKILKDLFYFDKLGSLGAIDDAKLLFKKDTLVDDDTTHDDSEYEMITSSERLKKGVDYEVTTNSKALSLTEANRDEPVMIDGKEVDITTIEVDNISASDYPDFSDAYANKAQFTDGTELTDKQLSMLDDNYSYLIRNAAEDSLTEKKLTNTGKNQLIFKK